MISPEQLSLMRNEWLNHFPRRVNPTASQMFEQLVTRYSTPDRAYHNLEHLAEMSLVVACLEPWIADPDAVYLAVWFHDAVYDTRANDNEERSAQLIEEFLAPLKVPRPRIDRVAGLVRATAHLTSTDPPADSDTAALLDADLAILGAAPERYARYASDIRLEHHWVPEADFRRGRSAVLRAFLARPRIFYHAVTQNEDEARARRNMEGELDSL